MRREVVVFVCIALILLMIFVGIASAFSFSSITGKVVDAGRVTGKAISDFFNDLFGASSTSAVDGDVLWAKNFGGIGTDVGYATATDANGNIFIVYKL